MMKRRHLYTTSLFLLFFQSPLIASICTPQVQQFTMAVNQMHATAGQSSGAQAAAAGSGMGSSVTGAAGHMSTSSGEEESGMDISGLFSGLGGITDIITGAGMHYEPDTRMKFYGIAGGLLTVNAFFFDDAGEKYRGQQEHCEELLATLESHDGAGNEEGSTGTTGGSSSGSTQSFDSSLSSGTSDRVDNNQQTSCYVGSGNLGTLVRDDSCGCLKNNTCAQVNGVSDFSASADQVTIEFPDIATDTAQATEQMANGVTSNDLDSATAAAEDIIKNAARIRKFYEDAKKAYNQALVKNGKKPANFDKIHANLKAGLIKGAKHDLKQGNPLYGQGSGRSAYLPRSLKKRNKITRLRPDKKVVPKTTKKSVVTKRKGFKSGLAKKREGIDYNISAEEAMKGRKPRASEISNKVDVNIFKIISYRYILSALPVLFEKKQESTPRKEEKK